MNTKLSDEVIKNMSNNKQVLIDEDLHTKVKVEASRRKEKIKDFVEKAIIHELSKQEA